MSELTGKEIERQDFVDNSIYQLILSLNPTNEKIDWNIEIIGQVREQIGQWFEQNNICTQSQFYPYLENGNS
jgi:hypothetical protein